MELWQFSAKVMQNEKSLKQLAIFSHVTVPLMKIKRQTQKSVASASVPVVKDMAQLEK
jgi:hypothetical protein